MNHLLKARSTRAFALTAVACAGLLVPSAAHAAVPITAFEAGPVAPFNNASTGLALDTDAGGPAVTDMGCFPDAPITRAAQAGGNTDYCLRFSLNPGDPSSGDDVKDTLVQLPVGTQGDIDSAAKCTAAQFNMASPAANTCPANTQIGTLIAKLDIGPPANLSDQYAPGRVYALETPDDKAAVLGVVLLGSTPLQSKYTITVSQLGNPLVGLQNQTSTLATETVVVYSPPTIVTAPIALKGSALRFWGKSADHAWAAGAPAADFMRIGTTCGTAQTASLTVNAVSSTSETSTSTYSHTGCESLTFNPSFTSAFSGETYPGGHPNLRVQIESPTADEDLGGVKVTMPSDIVVDLSRIQNACPQATFEAAGCADSAVIGSVTGKLSGIGDDVVKGDVVMVKIDGRSLPGVGLNFKGRLPLRVVGVSTTDTNNRLVSTFSNLPSLPVRSLDMKLDGGTKGILQVADTCTTSATEAVLTGQNGKTKSVSIPASCREQISATLGRTTSTSPTLTLGSAGATGKKLASVRIGLPKGLRFVSSGLRRSSLVTVSGLDTGVTGKTRVSKVGGYAKFTFPAGSNGYAIALKRGTLKATSSFAKSSKTSYVQFRYVYTDGTKYVAYAKLVR